MQNLALILILAWNFAGCASTPTLAGHPRQVEYLRSQLARVEEILAADEFDANLQREAAAGRAGLTHPARRYESMERDGDRRIQDLRDEVARRRSLLESEIEYPGSTIPYADTEVGHPPIGIECLAGALCHSDWNFRPGYGF